MSAHIMSRLTRPAMLPFYLLVFLNLCIYQPHIQRPPEKLMAAIFKILPILYLAFLVYEHKSGGKQNVVQGGSNSYLGHFLRGLLVSSLGDVCLLYQNYFKEGILCFGMAQFCYLVALKNLHQRSVIAWIAVPIGLVLYGILFPGIDEVILKVMVLFYCVLIHTMFFYAVAGYESLGSVPAMCGMLGAGLFILSDFLIACNKWITATWQAEGVVLLTYYLAQLLLTVSAC